MNYIGLRANLKLMAKIESETRTLRQKPFGLIHDREIMQKLLNS